MPLADLASEIAVAANPEAHPEARLEAARRAKALSDALVAAETAPDTRKSLEILMREVNEAKRWVSRTYRHRASGDIYCLLMLAFNERTNETKAVYCLAAMPALKFERPWPEFMASFEEDHGHAPRA